MAKGQYLGEFEQLVLLALLRLKDQAYGVTVRQEIQARTGRNVAIGAVYACLERLERKGCVRPTISEPEPVPGGRAKKFFRMTRQGAEAFRQTRRMMSLMSEDLAIDAELRSL